MNEKKLAGLNYLNLSLVILLILSFSAIGIAQFEDYNDFNLICAGVILTLITPFCIVLTGRIIILNSEYYQSATGSSGESKIYISILPLVVTIALIASSFFIYKNVENRAFTKAVKEVDDFKLEVAFICEGLFDDDNYFLEIKEETGDGYITIGKNDHVIIWQDNTNNAYWFDIADSLSSSGYVCIRPGMSISDAITNYEFWKKQRTLIHIFDNLYYWN
jgi:hypothetical protein